MFLVWNNSGNTMESLIPILIGLAGGAGGGILAGKLMNSSMGTMGRSLTGIIGGGGLAFLAPMIPGLAGVFGDPMAGAGLISSLISGGVGGGILTAILGKLKK
jgi:hypothetical protein